MAKTSDPIPLQEDPEEAQQEPEESPLSGPDESSNLSSLTQKSREIIGLTVPIILSEIFQNTMPIVDLAFVGRLTKDDLAAAALATVWFNLFNATMLGFATAIDTLLSQAYGAKNYKVFGKWTGNGIMIIMIMCVFMSGLLALCEVCMKLFGQEPEIAEAAGRFSYRLIPGIFPLFAFKILVKHLQTQDILLPGVVIGILANIFNIAANWVLIFGLDLGLDGAPIATTLTRFLEFFLIIAYFFFNRKQDFLVKTWPSFQPRDLLSKHSITTFMSLAASGALSFTAEAWSFEITTILAGILGTIELDAHIITLSIATFLYLSFPFSIGIAASIRVGQLIGEGRPIDARRSSLASFLLTVVVQVTLIVCLLPSSKALGRLFSSEPEVSDLAAELIPLSCLFMMGDSIQSTTGGVMRGLGQQRLVLYLNIVGFWMLGVPVGAILTFVADVGVKGLWFGMSIGIYSSAMIGVSLLRYRIDWNLEAKKAQDRVGPNAITETNEVNI